jgi:N-acetylmuramoyl-L-alanine amidase
MRDWFGRTKRAILSGWTTFGERRCATRPETARRVHAFERLEPRLALAAAGLVPVGAQPTGSLTGKIVYLSPGHGYQYDVSGQWYLGRDETQEMVESLGTQDQGTYLADYLFRAGATVVPMRPIGRQTNEVVLDNDMAEVTYTGSWSNSTGARFYDEDYGAGADAVHYRFASTSATETATASYTPNIPQSGFYPVYTWVSLSTSNPSNRTLQTYEVNHTGGAAEVKIDHSKVGNGWVYLGTYHFDAGSSATAGSVQISNEGAAGKVVIADAIRFGNGMGDVPDGPNGAGNSGGTLSGKPREDEAALLWIIRSIGQGVNTSTFFSVTGNDPNVSGPARLAEEMNANTNLFGSSVYLAIHSNAFNGTARGAIGLITNSGSPTPHQADFALWLGEQVNLDLRAVDQDLGFAWDVDRTNFTLTGAYGEINADDFTNSSGVVEMDASLAEVAFHDNAADALIMRDPKGRDAIGRALYHAIVQYFDVWGGQVSPATLPAAPTNISAVSDAGGQVTISWLAGPSSSAYGAAATDYRIYASSDGYGFDGGRLASSIAGGTATSKTISGLDPTVPYYFKVVALNSGGESPGTEVVTALPSGGVKQVLIVNGFDRNHVSQDFRYTTQETLPGSNITVDRVWSRYNNSFDYLVQVATAIQGSKPGVHVASTSNEAVISGAVNLNDFHTVIWILGTESTADDTFNAAEQTKVTNFINAGGNLFLSGSEIAWDLDQQNNGRTFFETTLQGDFVNDDAGTYTATADAGGIFSGMSSFAFSSGATFSNLDTQYYNVSFPDVISPQAGGFAALTYSGGIGGTAAIQVAGAGGKGSIVMFGFPFEVMTSAARRQTAMGRILDFFALSAPAPNADFNGDTIVDSGDYVLWRKNNGLTSGATQSQGDANGDGHVNQTDYAIWRSQFGTSPLVLGAGAGTNEDLSALALSQTTVAPLAAVLTSAPVYEEKSVSARELGFSALGAQQGERLSFPKRSAVSASRGFAQSNHDWAALLNIIAERRADRAAARLTTSTVSVDVSDAGSSKTQRSLSDGMRISIGGI